MADSIYEEEYELWKELTPEPLDYIEADPPFEPIDPKSWDEATINICR